MSIPEATPIANSNLNVHHNHGGKRTTLKVCVGLERALKPAFLWRSSGTSEAGVSATTRWETQLSLLRAEFTPSPTVIPSPGWLWPYLKQAMSSQESRESRRSLSPSFQYDQAWFKTFFSPRQHWKQHFKNILHGTYQGNRDRPCSWNPWGRGIKEPKPTLQIRRDMHSYSSGRKTVLSPYSSKPLRLTFCTSPFISLRKNGRWTKAAW